MFFGADELKIRRWELGCINPKMVKGCKREIKDMGNYKLYIFTPDVAKTTGAVIYYHGGGFACMTVGQGQNSTIFFVRTFGETKTRKLPKIYILHCCEVRLCGLFTLLQVR